MVFDFIPKSGVTKAFFNGVGDGQLRAVDFQAIGGVVENRFRKWIRTLENHADAAAQLRNVLGKDVLAVEENFAFETRVTHGFVHAVEGAEQSGFAAAGRADESGDFVRGDAEADVEESLLCAVEKVALIAAHAHGQGSDVLAIGRLRRSSRCDVYGHSLPHRCHIKTSGPKLR